MIINDVQFSVALEDVFEELKTQLHINGFRYFEKGYRNSGEHIMVQCPYHGDGQERKPSAGIRKSDGIFHCFACNEVHSLPEVISFCFGYSDTLGKDGWKWLLKNFATIQREKRKDIKLDYGRNTNNRSGPVDNSSDNLCKYIAEEELDSYRYYHKYWKNRGIIDENIIELFDLGYDKKTDCITFPIRDESGRCLFVARRSTKAKYFNYPQGAEKPLYGLYELYHWAEYEVKMSIAGAGELFICESMIDCLLLWQAGFFAVALNGLGNDLQFKQLNKIQCRKVILATDNDEAGQKARKRIKHYVKRKLFTEIDFPDGIKDIGECSKEQIDYIKDWEVF